MKQCEHIRAIRPTLLLFFFYEMFSNQWTWYIVHSHLRILAGTGCLIRAPNIWHAWSQHRPSIKNNKTWLLGKIKTSYTNWIFIGEQLSLALEINVKHKKDGTFVDTNQPRLRKLLQFFSNDVLQNIHMAFVWVVQFSFVLDFAHLREDL